MKATPTDTLFDLLAHMERNLTTRVTWLILAELGIYIGANSTPFQAAMEDCSASDAKFEADIRECFSGNGPVCLDTVEAIAKAARMTRDRKLRNLTFKLREAVRWVRVAQRA